MDIKVTYTINDLEFEKEFFCACGCGKKVNVNEESKIRILKENSKNDRFGIFYKDCGWPEYPS